MNTPFIIYANLDDLIDEVKRFCDNRINKGDRLKSVPLRLGSGEFIDSLGIEKIANINKTLVPALSQIGNLIFEIKTKSSRVDSLLNLNHHGRVVVAFSVNSLEVAVTEESEADPVMDRLNAAYRCQEAGYKIGFHFDPLIYYPGWEDGYQQIVDEIFARIDPGKIAWISLGALRFNPALKPVMMKKFPNSRLVYSELIPGLDGKMRYFIGIRKKMFSTMVKYIRSQSADIPIYLCMESRELAKEVGAFTFFAAPTF